MHVATYVHIQPVLSYYVLMWSQNTQVISSNAFDLRIILRNT